MTIAAEPKASRPPANMPYRPRRTVVSDIFIESLLQCATLWSLPRGVTGVGADLNKSLAGAACHASQLVLASAKGRTATAPAARTTLAAIVSVHPVSDRSSTSSTGPPADAIACGSGAVHAPSSAATR